MFTMRVTRYNFSQKLGLPVSGLLCVLCTGCFDTVPVVPAEPLNTASKLEVSVAKVPVLKSDMDFIKPELIVESPKSSKIMSTTLAEATVPSEDIKELSIPASAEVAVTCSTEEAVLNLVNASTHKETLDFAEDSVDVPKATGSATSARIFVISKDVSKDMRVSRTAVSCRLPASSSQDLVPLSFVSRASSNEKPVFRVTYAAAGVPTSLLKEAIVSHVLSSSDSDTEQKKKWLTQIKSNMQARAAHNDEVTSPASVASSADSSGTAAMQPESEYSASFRKKLSANSAPSEVERTSVSPLKNTDQAEIDKLESEIKALKLAKLKAELNALKSGKETVAEPSDKHVAVKQEDVPRAKVLTTDDIQRAISGN